MNASHALMATYLRNAAERADYSPERLAAALGYRTPVLVQRWFDGVALPPHSCLSRIAAVLGADVRALSVGWMIETVPTLDSPLRSLLEAAGLSFPSSHDDLAKLPPREAKGRASLASRRAAAILPPPRPKPGDYADGEG